MYFSEALRDDADLKSFPYATNANSCNCLTKKITEKGIFLRLYTHVTICCIIYMLPYTEKTARCKNLCLQLIY